MCEVHDQKSATLATCHVARLVGVKTLVDIEQSLSPDLSPIQGKSLCNGRICPLEAKKELIKLNFFDPGFYSFKLIAGSLVRSNQAQPSSNPA